MATAKKTLKTTRPARKAAPVKARAPATPKLPAKPARLAAPPAAAPVQAQASKSVKADKPRKPKLVRDSFTIPKAEFTVLAQLKQRAMQSGLPVKKSELLRAGIKALAAMNDAAFAAALGAVPAIKTGRPAKV